MKEDKKVIGIIGLAAVVALVVIAVVIAINLNRPVESGAERDPKIGSFVLETSGGVAYEWRCAIDDDTVAKYGNVKSRNLDANSDGGRIEEVHEVIALKKGNAKIHCDYSNMVEYDGKPTENRDYLVNVDDSLDINITDITADLHEDEEKKRLYGDFLMAIS